jgi:adenine/guanine phosphoribosyltransferase-like PRPP-binding protein
MSDKLDLKKHIRNVDDFPIPGIKFRDITSLIETPEPFTNNELVIALIMS